MNEADSASAGTNRWCSDCDDETRHRQVGGPETRDSEYQCLACHERIEIEAALGLRDQSGESGEQQTGGDL